MVKYRYNATLGKFEPDLGDRALAVSQLPTYDIFDGDKFPGGFGITREYIPDYWTLRLRSGQLFSENLYARGVIRRLVTNEINTGLNLEATPSESVLGFTEDALTDWSDDVETRFHLWARDAKQCDYYEQNSLFEIQKLARMEALVSGDVLIVLRQNPVTKLPNVQLVEGSRVRTPVGKWGDRSIVEGVQLDERGRHIGYWVTDDEYGFEHEFVPAYGSSGRRIAWLYYGSDKRLGDVRGQPILSIILQSLKEIDRYRDSAQRKALVNSFLAMFIAKTENKPSTRPFGGGATRVDKYSAVDSDGKTRAFNIAKHMPGLVMEELQTGETPHAFGSQGTDIDFGKFEEIIVAGMAWGLEIPPEIMRLAFSSNYSASQAATSEFKMYLNKIRGEFGEHFCQPVYEDWLLSMVLLRRIAARGLLDAWRDVRKREAFSAWVDADWSGAIKPSIDIVKQANGYKKLEAEGWITNDRAARELTGTKWFKNIKRLRRENELKVAAAEPLAAFRQKYGEQNATAALDQLAETVAQAVGATVEDALDGMAQGM